MRFKTAIVLIVCTMIIALSCLLASQEPKVDYFLDSIVSRPFPIKGGRVEEVIERRRILSKSRVVVTRIDCRNSSLITVADKKAGVAKLFIVNSPYVWKAPLSQVSVGLMPKELEPGAVEGDERLGESTIFGQRCYGSRVAIAEKHYFEYWASDVPSVGRRIILLEEFKDGASHSKELTLTVRRSKEDDKLWSVIPPGIEELNVTASQWESKYNNAVLDGHRRIR